jgi:flagellar protein FliL
MAQAAEAVALAGDEAAVPARKKGKGLLAGLAALLLCGGGGFYATFSGLLALPFGGGEAPSAEAAVEPLAPVAFVGLDKILVSLGPEAKARHLAVAAQLEVDPAYQADVTLLLPRVMDVANTYLRAVEVRDLEDPHAMGRIRAQLLRRIQIVTGEGRVRDLLITQFVLD